MGSLRASAYGGVGLAALLAFGCHAKVELATLPDAPPASRAANSFLHCVEGTNSLCVHGGPGASGWDALAILAWAAYGSPGAISTYLPEQMKRHEDPRSVERRFVEEVERYSITLRGAGCMAVAEQPLAPIVQRAAARTMERAKALRLWPREIVEVVEHLRQEADVALREGTLVTMSCDSDPFVVYTATTLRDGRYKVVGMTTLWPEPLGGTTLDPEKVTARLHGRALGLTGGSGVASEATISPWLPFAVEEF